jgi:Acyl-protein synthetase, LuxE
MFWRVVQVAPAGLPSRLSWSTGLFQAVAENQPGNNQNRVSALTSLAGFAARVRRFIRAASTGNLAGQSNLGGQGDTDFNDLALEAFGLQFDSCLPFRTLCLARGSSPTAVRHWMEIPAVPTAAFKELELSSLDPGERTAVFYSSGTTARQPSRHFHCPDSLALYEASLRPWFCAHLLPDLAPNLSGPPPSVLSPQHAPLHVISLTPPKTQAPHSSLVHMFDVVAREFGGGDAVFVGSSNPAGTWSLDLQGTFETLQQFAASGRPALLLGTAFLFLHLADYLSQRKTSVRLPADSRVLETGGYKGRSRSLSKAGLHALLTERLGIARTGIVCEYGMSELSSQAYDRVIEPEPDLFAEADAGRCFRFPPWARAVVVSPETGLEVADGQTGLLRIVDLANVYSVMSIQTEDVVVQRREGFELVGRVAWAEPRGCSLLAVPPGTQ